MTTCEMVSQVYMVTPMLEMPVTPWHQNRLVTSSKLGPCDVNVFDRQTDANDLRGQFDEKK